eukprot:755259-Hanusia_phi.AAC.11
MVLLPSSPITPSRSPPHPPLGTPWTGHTRTKRARGSRPESESLAAEEDDRDLNRQRQEHHKEDRSHPEVSAGRRVRMRALHDRRRQEGGGGRDLVDIQQGAAIPVEAVEDPNIHEERSDRADGSEDEAVDELDGHPGIRREVTYKGDEDAGQAEEAVPGKLGRRCCSSCDRSGLLPTRSCREEITSRRLLLARPCSPLRRPPASEGDRLRSRRRWLCTTTCRGSKWKRRRWVASMPCSEDSDRLNRQRVHDRSLRGRREAREDGKVKESEVDKGKRMSDLISASALSPHRKFGHQIDQKALDPEAVDVSAPLGVVLPVGEDCTPVVAHEPRGDEDDRRCRYSSQHSSHRNPVDELRVEIDNPSAEVESKKPCT